MLSSADLIHLPYTRDLTDGGIAYALRSIPYLYRRHEGSSYNPLRRMVAGAAAQLAFRRYLSEKNIPFEVRGAVPFTEHDRYDVSLGRQRCDLQSFLIQERDQIAELQRNPQSLLKKPALVASDQHAGEGHSPFDLYLFAFVCGHIAAFSSELQKTIGAGQPSFLVHVMPAAWARPMTWNPLGTLVLKSEAEETQTVEVGGQDEGRAMQSCQVELPPRQRVEIPNHFFSLTYIHIRSGAKARLGIHCPTQKELHLIGTRDWDNLWVYGTDILLAGYMTRDEFGRRARFVQAGSPVFQYHTTQQKNLAVPVSELRPLSELFDQMKSAPERA
jgi:hypothetical protein